MQCHSEIDINQHAQIEWACRRGMLELDLLFKHFFLEIYPTLPLVEKKIFVHLLGYNDIMLFDYLFKEVQAPSQDIINMIEKIRSHAQSRICTKTI